MKKTILITGANGGFGKLTVNSLISKGYGVVAAIRDIKGRNLETTKYFTEAGALVVEMDVTDTDSVNSGVEKAVDHFGRLDVVVNNAGIGVMGMQEQFTVEDFHKLFDVNVYGIQRVNRATIPHLREAKSGLIIYTSSLLGRMTLPFYGPYNASKFAVEALAENYRVELSQFGIENAIVEPGAFGTGFSTSLMPPSDQSIKQPYEKMTAIMHQMGEGFGQALKTNEEQKPQRVADAIVGLIETEHGKRAFRTTVDFMGMGKAVNGLNEVSEEVTNGLYKNFHMDAMLTIQ